MEKKRQKIPIDYLLDNIGTFLRQAREEAGITYYEVAKRCKIHRMTINRIEKGMQPRTPLAAELIRVLYQDRGLGIPEIRLPWITPKVKRKKRRKKRKSKKK